MPYKDPAVRRVNLREHYAKNRELVLARHKRWRDANREHCADYRRQYRGPRGPKHIQERYGLSLEDYQRMAQVQDGKCAICKELPVGNGSMDRLHVDHCHDTNLVRDLLCSRCNKGLGCF